MNGITKTVLLSSLILSIGLILTINGNISEAVPISESPSHEYGKRTANIVCGDHLCNESRTITSVNPITILYDHPLPQHLMSIETITIHHLGDKDKNAYLVYYRVYAGDQNVQNIRLVIQSDIEYIGTQMTSIFSEDSSVFVVRIHAIDPSSITARISAYQLS